MFKPEEAETHPAFGLVGFSRIQGNPGKLFGSNMETHGTYILLRLHRAKRYHDLSQDWIMAHRETLFEVMLSPNQFAELLTTINVGEGVPCTINRMNGKSVEAIPETDKTEIQRIHDGFDEQCSTLLGDARDKLLEAQGALLRKETLKRGERKKIAELLDAILREIESNMPFHLKRFQAATEKTVVEAKAELDAFVTTRVMDAGLAALRGQLKPPAQTKEEVETGLESLGCPHHPGNYMHDAGCPDCEAHHDSSRRGGPAMLSTTKR